MELNIERLFIEATTQVGLNPNNLERPEIFEPYWGAMGKSMIRAIYRMATKDEVEAEYPSDWWQAVKLRWYPKFLLNHYPAKFTKIIAKHKFPHIAVPEYVHVITVNDSPNSVTYHKEG